jgi:TolB protein
VATAEVATSAPPLSGWIAFPLWNAATGKYDTYVSRPNGSERRLVLAGAQQPAFSPDGTWLAVNGERSLQENLLLVRPDGSEVLEVTKHTEDGLPAWSSDGRRLAYSSTQHGDRQSRLYVLDPVPLDGSKGEGRTLLAGQNDARGAFPAWSADGHVLYSGCDYTAEPSQCGLLLLSAEPDPQVPQRLTDHPGDTAPAVAGDWVAFMSDREGTWAIYRLRIDGSGLQRLTTAGPAIAGLPTWSPDGRTIAFVSDQGSAWAIWVMNADGSGQRKLFDLGGSLGENWPQQRISWGP